MGCGDDEEPTEMKFHAFRKLRVAEIRELRHFF
jgi:hypothetical protein